MSKEWENLQRELRHERIIANIVVWAIVITIGVCTYLQFRKCYVSAERGDIHGCE